MVLVYSNGRKKDFFFFNLNRLSYREIFRSGQLKILRNVTYCCNKYLLIKKSNAQRLESEELEIPSAQNHVLGSFSFFHGNRNIRGSRFLLLGTLHDQMFGDVLSLYP